MFFGEFMNLTWRTKLLGCVLRGLQATCAGLLMLLSVLLLSCREPLCDV